METQPRTIQQRVIELEAAMNIANAEGDLAFAKLLRGEITWLQAIIEREAGTDGRHNAQS